MYCGKCGSQLDEITNLCPKCDTDKIAVLYLKEMEKAALRKKKIRKIVTTIIILLVFILTASVVFFLWNAKKIHIPDSTNSSTLATFPEIPSETIITTAEPTQVQPQGDPIDAYLQNIIYPKYGQVQSSFSIPYRSFSSMKPPLFEVNDDFGVLLAISRADYDQNGIEDLLAVTLDSAYTRPDGLGDIFFHVRLYFFGENGSVKDEVSIQHWGSLTPSPQESISLFNMDKGIVWCNSLDKCVGYRDQRTDKWLPITNNINEHIDALAVFDFSDFINRADSDYHCYRSSGTSNEASYFSSNLLNPFFYNHYGWKDQMCNSEEDACAELMSVLQNQFRLNEFELEPFSWSNRWRNTFLPKNDLNGVVCSITMQASLSELSADNKVGGVMTVQVSVQ